jgi:hypothetical protein
MFQAGTRMFQAGTRMFQAGTRMFQAGTRRFQALDVCYNAAYRTAGAGRIGLESEP